MKAKHYGLLILIALVNLCCESKSFDLTSVSLGEDAKKYDFENKNIFLKDETPEKSVIQYYADENKNITYGNIALDQNLGTRITVYKNKVAAIQTHADPKYSLQFVDKILKGNGKPTTQIIDKAHVDAKASKQIFTNLKNQFPNDVVWIKNEPDTFQYPTSFFWDKDNSYYILSISIESDGTIKNQYLSVTKEAYRNNVVFGLKYPAPKESPWYNYMK
ncbi:hypothetical protein [Chryseobacterium sp. G0201]|uniref:hypothetical protein n=1 Tax=Chryseobacterium sp. G0201 TaxID=2487065 RepID=UPI000F4F7F99|nr:hypothetical protein [Chryseobacterium sp. G0201]AZA51723.1 hypothetical protein EG348_01205 [Chryseobacterium sp. G0201]